MCISIEPVRGDWDPQFSYWSVLLSSLSIPISHDKSEILLYLLKIVKRFSNHTTTQPNTDVKHAASNKYCSYINIQKNMILKLFWFTILHIEKLVLSV